MQARWCRDGGAAAPARICRVRRSKRGRNVRTWTARISCDLSQRLPVTPGRQRGCAGRGERSRKGDLGGQVQGVEHQPADSKPRGQRDHGARNSSGASKADTASRNVGDDDDEAAGALPDEAVEGHGAVIHVPRRRGDAPRVYASCFRRNHSTPGSPPKSLHRPPTRRRRSTGSRCTFCARRADDVGQRRHGFVSVTGAAAARCLPKFFLPAQRRSLRTTFAAK